VKAAEEGQATFSILSVEKRMNTIRPVHTIRQTYFGWDGAAIGSWGEPMKIILKNLNERDNQL
jgi:hypothetical protein